MRGASRSTFGTEEEKINQSFSAGMERSEMKASPYLGLLIRDFSIAHGWRYRPDECSMFSDELSNVRIVRNSQANCPGATGILLLASRRIIHKMFESNWEVRCTFLRELSASDVRHGSR
jgi:hypothetical protein